MHFRSTRYARYAGDPAAGGAGGRETRHAIAVTFALAATLSLSFGCSSPGETGVLGNGQFRYLCQNGEDTACSASDSVDVSLPNAIAVGATFSIGYSPKSSSGGTVQGATGYEIVPASSRMATATGNTIEALREGYVALLARQVGNADVDDFVHLRFSAVRSLIVVPSTSLVIAAGSEAAVALQPLDALGVPLAGRLLCQWQVTAGTPWIALNGSSLGPSATIAVVAGATTTSGNVRAVCGAMTIDVPVVVTAGAPGDGGAPDSGPSGSDAGPSILDGGALAPDGGSLE
jgi:hypothetical protein